MHSKRNFQKIRTTLVNNQVPPQIKKLCWPKMKKHSIFWSTGSENQLFLTCSILNGRLLQIWRKIQGSTLTKMNKNLQFLNLRLLISSNLKKNQRQFWKNDHASPALSGSEVSVPDDCDCPSLSALRKHHLGASTPSALRGALPAPRNFDCEIHEIFFGCWDHFLILLNYFKK